MTILLEEGVGTIPVTLKVQEDGAVFIQMSQPLPTFGLQFADRQLAADMLSLETAAFDAQLPCEVVSCGLPFLFLPLKDLEVMKRIRLRSDVVERILPNLNVAGAFVFVHGARRRAQRFIAAYSRLPWECQKIR